MFDHIRAGWDQNQPDEKRVFGGESSVKGPGFWRWDSEKIIVKHQWDTQKIHANPMNPPKVLKINQFNQQADQKKKQAEDLRSQSPPEMRI